MENSNSSKQNKKILGKMTGFESLSDRIRAIYIKAGLI